MNDEQRIITFRVGGECYAMPLLSVREVIALPTLTGVPFAPPQFLGITNLRGQVISIFDLRIMVGLKRPADTQETAVIIINFDQLRIGVVVDSVDQVIVFSKDELSPAPELRDQRGKEYLTGVIRKEGKLLLLVDIAKALGVEDLAIVAEHSGAKVAA
ncbi:MAG TPA: chemotaxis protein CheW [Bdellovibrionota bacterium]|jgi:purine-binding chemotaxis protein CheW|nr:chemotaxis protein CheW [Bdellovibrionota bacterium]